MHSGTSYKDLNASIQRLQTACEKQSEVTKNVVKQHFAKFVNAKGNIDSFYQQMRQSNLVSNSEYGVMPFIKALEGKYFYLILVLIQSSKVLYSPILERQQHAEKLRYTLSFLEQWKFFFHLPSILQKYIAKVQFSTYNIIIG